MILFHPGLEDLVFDSDGDYDFRFTAQNYAFQIQFRFYNV